MPLRNRVTPLGELIADRARGLAYGNRGCLHDERKDPELFFLDEATAFAAGHVIRRRRGHSASAARFDVALERSWVTGPGP